MSGILYVVGTPIGNLSDFSPRAIDTLASVDFIAAEDTRVTLKLLNHFDIKKEMVSYFEHNKRQRGEIICQRILAGENCAIVTDAGMPAISDPGEDLVALCHEFGIVVQSVPGPTAFATALAISGMPTGRFTFEGFLSVNKKSRSEVRAKKHRRLRNRISGTASTPRLAVFRSNNHMYAQIIDDTVGKTLVSASTVQKEVKAELEKTNDVAAAAHLGTVIAKRAIEKGITTVVFDRGGFIYQGKIQALADAAREAGLNF